MQTVPLSLVFGPDPVLCLAHVVAWRRHACAAAPGGPAGDEACWAVWVDRSGSPVAGTHRSPGVDPGIDWLDGGFGCPCCAGLVVLRTVLARRLRRGGVDRIVLVLPGGADPGRLADLLRQPPLSRHLSLDAVIHCPAPGNVDPPPAVASRLAGIGTPPAAERLAAWPAMVLTDAAPAGWWEARTVPPAACHPDGTWDDGGRRWQRAWGGERLLDRRAVQAAASRLAALPGLQRLDWLARTERDWYRWHWSDAGPAAAGPASAGWPSPEPAGWRLDSRLLLQFAPAVGTAPRARRPDPAPLLAGVGEGVGGDPT